MATSRTGLATHINWRKRVLARDRALGVTHCPYCNTRLDYDNSKRPNSAEPDHIKPWAAGGGNTLDNGQTICRQCNQRKGSGNVKRRGNRLVNVPLIREVSGEEW